MSHYGQGLKENSYNCEKFTILNYNTNAIGGDALPSLPTILPGYNFF